MVIGIYKIINIKNNKVYIGSSKDIERRWKEHLYSLENNLHHSIKLQRSYNKTKDKSTFNFEIIKEVDEDKLKEREQYYINMYDAFNNGYNCCAEVDNPKYTLSNVKKISKKEKLDYFYDRFMALYGQYQDSLELGVTFIDRLSSKHYQYGVYKTNIEIIEWFISNYNPNEYVCRFSFNSNRQYFIIIGDIHGNEFVCYKRHKDKIYNSNQDSEAYRRHLEKDNKLNEAKHYMINVPNLPL